MISLKELNPKNFPLDKTQAANLIVLHEKINLVRTAYGKPMTVTSGFRSKEDHIRIYREIAQRKHVELEAFRIPMGSAHLKGCAVDIADPDGSLMQWCRDNVALLVELELWIEDDVATPRVHFQTYAPKSGSRFFKP